MLINKRFIIVLALMAGIISAVSAADRDADESLRLLKEGNARFVAMKMQNPDVSAARRSDSAATAQKPLAIVLACSDSRVPVEMIFDRGIGDIFVVRVAGNVATDPSVIGSIEYGVEHLNSPLLVVMGHTGCGAVKAAISGPPLDGDMRHVQDTIKKVADEVKRYRPDLSGDDLTLAVVKANIIQETDHILSGSKEIRRMMDDGKLKISTAVYDLKTGQVDWM